MIRTLATTVAICAGFAALVALCAAARPLWQWLIDHAPSPIHHAADVLGACNRHP